MIIHECQQGSPEWFAARLGKATASCFSDATSKGRGSAPSKTRKSYMLQLIAERMTGEPQEGYSNAIMARGSEIEPLAREYYELLNGVSVRQVGFVERDENTGASPDGLIGEDGILEIKSPNSTTHIEYILADKFPATYKPQVQGQLWICERQWADFISYDPRVSKRPYFCKRIYRDENYVSELEANIDMFVVDMKRLMKKLTASPF